MSGQEFFKLLREYDRISGDTWTPSIITECYRAGKNEAGNPDPFKAIEIALKVGYVLGYEVGDCVKGLKDEASEIQTYREALRDYREGARS